MDLDRLLIPRNHKLYPMRDYVGKPADCPACHFHTDNFHSYSWDWHISQVRAAIESLTPSGMMLLGKAASPTGRSETTVWIHNIWTKEPLPYAIPPWLHNDISAPRSGPATILRALKRGARWTLIQGSEAVFYGWVMGMNRTGKDEARIFSTEMNAIAGGMVNLSKLQAKNWDVTLSVDFVDKEVKAVVVGPKKDSITVLSDLITKSRNAKDTKTRIRRMKEIDDMLDQMEVLKDVRADLHSRLLLS